MDPTDSREELNSLQSQLDKTQSSRRQLETQLKTQKDATERLERANNDLSTRALSLADDAEAERTSLTKRLQDEIAAVKRQMASTQEDADEERARGQAQRIQLLDEVSCAFVLN